MTTEPVTLGLRARIGRWWLRRADPALYVLLEGKSFNTLYRMAEKINSLKRERKQAP